MIAGGRDWSVRLSEAAAADFQDIVRWTAARFGARLARVYGQILIGAMSDLGAGPSALGVRSREDIGEGLFTLHVTGAGRKGRHLILFRAEPSPRRVIEVLRLLHDAMEIARHLPDDNGGEP